MTGPRGMGLVSVLGKGNHFSVFALASTVLTVDFGEVKTAPTDAKKNAFR